MVYYKTYFDLEGRKDKLFNTGDPSKWGVDFSKEGLPKGELLKNKVVAKQLILREEGPRLREEQLMFGYFNQLCFRETVRYRDWVTQRYLRAVTQFTNLQIEHLTEVEASHEELGELQRTKRECLRHLRREHGLGRQAARPG